jgi:hypothetical protein
VRLREILRNEGRARQRRRERHEQAASKPTLSLSYATKHDVVMAGMGLSEFCLPARTVDVDQLIERFKQMEARSAELRAAVSERNATITQQVERQFALLSALLLPGSKPAPRGPAEHQPAPESCW